MSSHSRRTILALGIVSLVGLGFGIGANGARACVNELVRLYLLPEGIRRVEGVERLIARGDTRRAYVAAHDVLSAIDGAEAIDRRGELLDGSSWADEIEEGLPVPATRHPDRARELEARAALLHAILVIRLDGQISRSGRPARHVHETVREEHLAGALAALEMARAAHADDPRVRAYHAEATAEADRATALATLRDLAARNLLGDPLSWVALASLETEESARETALGRCRTIVAARATRVCAVAADAS